MSRRVTIPDLLKEVLDIRDSKLEGEDPEVILKKVRRYARAINKYIDSGATDGLAEARQALDAIKDVEDKLLESKIQKEGPPDIDPKEIKYDAEEDYLGGGAFGSVYKCQCRGQQWAVKVPKVARLSSEKLEEFKKEIHVMKKVYHPNVVLFLGASTDPIMVVTELMTGGDLEGLIHKPQKYATLTLEKKLNIALGVSAGMNWLHGICHIIHRDLKPANILLDRNGTPKIADFGFSETLSRDNQQVRDDQGPKGTPRYMAPEIMLGKPLDKSVDVYAFGIILYELMTGKLSFSTYSDYGVFSRDVIAGVRPVVDPSDGVPPAVADLMARCWAPEPTARPTFEDITKSLRASLFEAFIPSEEARAFWLENFEDEQRIRFFDLRRLAGSARVDLSPLEPVLCDASGEISMAHFARLYSWLGPWFNFDGSRATLEELDSLIKKDWFHGFIDKDTATIRLTNRAVGTFLVRLSDTTPGSPFTISYISPSGMRHFRVKKIKFNPSAYELSGRLFNSLDEIVNGYAASGVLTFPCPKNAVPTVY